MDEQPTLGALVWRLSMRWRTAVDNAVEPLGLTHAQYVALSTLRGLHRSRTRPTQRELAERTGLDAIYISKLVRTLEAGGLVTRTPDGRDTRAVRLAVTPAGVRTADRAITRVSSLLDQLAAPLGGTGSERSADLAATLAALLANPLVPGGS